MTALSRELQSDRNEAVAWRSGKLWSLWDMLEIFAKGYIELGQRIEQARVVFHFTAMAGSDDPERHLNGQERKALRDCLIDIFDLCHRLDLPISGDLISSRFEKTDGDPDGGLPKTLGEYDLLIQAVLAELKNKLFFYVPPNRAKFYDIIFPSIVTTAFPSASKELVCAGNALACGLYTACVFHAMRAAEIGLRVLAEKLKVSFPDKPIKLAEWNHLIEQCETKIAGMKHLKPKARREKELNFYSQAAAQFRWFKDGFRVRTAHARETFEEIPATRIFTHTHEFFETLSSRLKERPAWGE